RQIQVLIQLLGKRSDPGRPLASAVLTAYLRRRQLPPWTAFFLHRGQVINDQWGLSHFNWPVEGGNYHVLRTGCYPYVKYHCTRAPPDPGLLSQDRFYTCLKAANFGLPTLAYGLAARFLAKHSESISVETARSPCTFGWLRPGSGQSLHSYQPWPISVHSIIGQHSGAICSSSCVCGAWQLCSDSF
ncbi:hypothetical protein BOX15_Mlig027064g1, partial [Macrostomum lignano]